MASTTSRPRTDRSGAAIVALAPAVLLAAHLMHPFLTVLPDAEGVAAAVTAGTTRWAAAHLLTAVGSALIAVAFIAVRGWLQDAGEHRSSSWGLPLVVFGSVLYAVLPGFEFAPLAAVETGGDVVAVQAALETWFVPVFVTGAVCFGIGALAFAKGVAASGLLGPGTRRTVVAALAVMAAARAVPFGPVQFHLQGLAAVVALWPIALDLWRHPVTVTTSRRSFSPAT